MRDRRQRDLPVPSRAAGKSSGGGGQGLAILSGTITFPTMVRPTLQLQGRYPWHAVFPARAAQPHASAPGEAGGVRPVAGARGRLRGQTAAGLAAVMPAGLGADDMASAARMRKTHARCDGNGDIASASLLEVRIDQAGGRIRFRFDAHRRGEPAVRIVIQRKHPEKRRNSGGKQSLCIVGVEQRGA
jgi:hypothetical protein